MKRRDFFSAAALSVAGLVAITNLSFANTINTLTIPELKNQHRRFTVTQKHSPIAQKVLKVSLNFGFHCPKIQYFNV